MPLAQLSGGFQLLPPLPTSKLSPFRADSRVGGLVHARFRTLWVSPTNSSVRLGVSPDAASTPTGFFSQRFEALFSHWNPGLCGLSHSPVVLPG